MKNYFLATVMFTVINLLPASVDATEIGEFCWNYTYFNETGSWAVQVTRHGNFYTAIGKDVSSDGIENRQNAIIGSGYPVGNELRIAMVNIAMNEPYGVDDISMGHGVFVVSLLDFSGSYHFTDEDIDACLPETAPCAKSVPLTPVACP